jgi:large conductance mechanosensitive channel
MGILHEFKTFAMRGNVLDMAVGIIIGAAFGKIVSSLVADVIMPPLGMIIGGVDFSALSLTLRAASESNPEVVLRYGTFLQQVFDFTMVAFAIFLLIKAVNRFKAKQEAAPAEPAKPPAQEMLLAEIRDLLQKKA